jgi:Cd2+/Zn2+-exporting ATPase
LTRRAAPFPWLPPARPTFPEGLRAVVLTGDRQATADHLRAELRIEDMRAELRPEEKLAAIRSLPREGRRVPMVGDGVNDALSLAAFRLSQRARRVIRQNLIISLGTVVVLVTFAILGRIPLTVGVVGHEGSTVVVVMNSLRLLFGAARPIQTSR